MKKFIPFLFLITCFSVSVDAQTNVRLTVNHKLGDENFALNQPAVNNMGHTFQVSRLQYYISEISIIHDGNTETAVEDLYVLVNAADTTEIDLGSHNVNSIEGLTFHIGVDEAHNHLDPASWPMGHPLAPTFPSMHWGWAAGYRFIAMEGKGGTNLNQTFELHCLGDQNYHKKRLFLNAVEDNGQLEIQIDADYARALENIPVNNGVIEHSEVNEAAETLNNFKNYVFSPSPGFTSTNEKAGIKQFKVFPNPAINGQSRITLEAENNQVYQVTVTDLLGQEVRSFNQVRNGDRLELNLDLSGMYFVNLIKNGQSVLTEKLVSKR